MIMRKDCARGVKATGSVGRSYRVACLGVTSSVPTPLRADDAANALGVAGRLARSGLPQSVGLSGNSSLVTVDGSIRGGSERRNPKMQGNRLRIVGLAQMEDHAVPRVLASRARDKLRPLSAAAWRRFPGTLR